MADSEWEDVGDDEWEDAEPSAAEVARLPMSWYESALKGVQDIPTFNFGDEIGGAIQAGLLGLSGDSDPIAKNYRTARDELRRESKQAAHDNPRAYYGAGIAATLPLAVGGPAQLTGRVARNAAPLARAWAGAKAGGLSAAISGAGASESPTLEGVALDSAAAVPVGMGLGAVGSTGAGGRALLGAGLGALSDPENAGRNALLGAGAGVLAPAARWIPYGVVKPNAAAQALRDRGVQGLTVGQMDPASVIGRAEESALPKLGVGNFLQRKRDAAQDEWQRLVLPGDGTVEQRLVSADDALEKAYDSVRRARVHERAKLRPTTPETLARGLQKSLDETEAALTPDEISKLRSFLENQAGLAEREGPKVKPDTLMRVRSNIRRLKRETPEEQSQTRRALVDAEEAINSRLRYALPKEKLETLAGADAGYRRNEVIADANVRARGREGGFTPSQLLAAVAGNSDRSRFARGQAGELQELGSLGKRVFEDKLPKTGWQMGVEWLPDKAAITSGLAGLANLGPVKSSLLGETPLQSALRRPIDALSRPLTQNEALEQMLWRIQTEAKSKAAPLFAPAALLAPEVPPSRGLRTAIRTPDGRLLYLNEGAP